MLVKALAFSRNGTRGRNKQRGTSRIRAENAKVSLIAEHRRAIHRGRANHRLVPDLQAENSGFCHCAKRWLCTILLLKDTTAERRNQFQPVPCGNARGAGMQQSKRRCEFAKKLPPLQDEALKPSMFLGPLERPNPLNKPFLQGGHPVSFGKGLCPGVGRTCSALNRGEVSTTQAVPTHPKKKWPVPQAAA